MTTDSGANPTGKPDDTADRRRDSTKARDEGRPAAEEPPVPVDLDTAHDRAS